MALMTDYLITTGNAGEFFDSLINANAPERFTYKFLENLGFNSSNDRKYVSVLKGLGFLTESSEPSEQYYQLLDHSQWKSTLANAIRAAYSDLFDLNRNANKMETEEIKNKFRTLTRGQKTDLVLNRMASTFATLCELADWSTNENPKGNSMKREEAPAKAHRVHQDEATVRNLNEMGNPSLHYNIQIHLPESKDPAVYDAIFQSLRKHLL